MDRPPDHSDQVHGEFLTLEGERYYAIRNVDEMAPFFVSLVSSSDHWLFVSSTGGLTAGRVAPETALFPYVTVDKIHDSTSSTGCLTLIRAGSGDAARLWEPFATTPDRRYTISRNIDAIEALYGSLVRPDQRAA